MTQIDALDVCIIDSHSGIGHNYPRMITMRPICILHSVAPRASKSCMDGQAGQSAVLRHEQAPLATAGFVLVQKPKVSAWLSIWLRS